jgi:hypothetical protein
MMLGRFIKRVVDVTEPAVAPWVERFSSTPEAISMMMEYDRLSRQFLIRTDKLRSDFLHVLALPSARDVRVLAHDLDRIRVSLEELQARMEDQQP